MLIVPCFLSTAINCAGIYLYPYLIFHVMTPCSSHSRTTCSQQYLHTHSIPPLPSISLGFIPVKMIDNTNQVSRPTAPSGIARCRETQATIFHGLHRDGG